MRSVTDIETIDDQYCFCLRCGSRDIALFVFRTEEEARLASDALQQIAQHAVEILPPAEADTDGQDAATQEQTGAPDADKAGAEGPETVAASPFPGT